MYQHQVEGRIRPECMFFFQLFFINIIFTNFFFNRMCLLRTVQVKQDDDDGQDQRKVMASHG